DRAFLALADLVDLVDDEHQQHSDDNADHHFHQAHATLAGKTGEGKRGANWSAFVLRTPVFALGTARRAHGFFPIWAVIKCLCSSVSPGSFQNTVTTTVRLLGDGLG